MVAVNEANERAAVEAEKARRKRKAEEQKAWEGESFVLHPRLTAWPILTRPGLRCFRRWVGSRCCLTRLARRRLLDVCERTDADAMPLVRDLLTSFVITNPSCVIGFCLQSAETSVLATGATICTRRRSAKSRRPRRTCTSWASSAQLLRYSPSKPQFHDPRSYSMR